jgi:DNA-binding beta-propeller fold protein YncE
MKTILTSFATVILLTLNAFSAENLYVVNTLGESLSKIDLTTGAVTNNILTLGSDIGSAPNQIVMRDTIGYVVCSGTDEIHIVRFPSQISAGFIPTGAGSNPFWMSCYDSSLAVVSLMTENKIGFIDLNSRTIIRKDSIGLSPAGVEIVNHMACVAISAFDFGTFTYGQGQLAVFDIKGDSIKGWVNVGVNPQYVVGRSNFAYVICTGDYGSVAGEIHIVDVNTLSVVDTIPIGGSPGPAEARFTGLGPNTAAIAAGGWVADGHAYQIDMVANTVLNGPANPILTGMGCSAVAWRRNGNLMAASFGPDQVSNTTTSTNYTVGDGPIDMEFQILPGDVNGDFKLNISDITFYVNGLFVGDQFLALYPRWVADVSADGKINIVDITRLVAYLFQSGARPRMGWTWHNY